MDEINQLKQKIKTLNSHVIKLEKQVKNANDSIKLVISSLNDVNEIIKDVKTPSVKQVYRSDEIKEVNTILKSSFGFWPTKDIARYLKGSNAIFDPMSVMSIGILLSKCGFRSGTKNGVRGYYLTKK